MKILLNNDKMRIPSRKVEVRDILETVHEGVEMIALAMSSNGIGLTGVQVGIMKTFFVAIIKGSWEIVINPKIVSYGKNMVLSEEGCLSYPEEGQGKIERHRKIKVQFIDKKGNLIIAKLTKMDAIVFQHEFDHTQGIVCIDKFVT